jgi:type IV secretory pathway VirB4 component
MPAIAKATQDFVPIKEIRDGVIILKDGSMRAIVMVSSINFALKSIEEQEAVIYQFQNFLNSLDFSVQISIQSRELDIRPYLAQLEERYKAELSDLMKIQIREYIAFIRSFVEQSSIMTKTFFVVIPFSQVLTAKNAGSIASNFLNKKKEEKPVNKDSFLENRTQLEQRIGVVQGGLIRCGLKSIALGTDEIIELFYKIFNPGDLEKPIINT